jgi:hypothetical protein
MENTTTPPANLLPVLVATHETQGQRRNDFCWCDDDEPVRLSSECDGEPIDGRCGCRRSMSGMVTLKATTTVRVALLSLNRDGFVAMLKACLEKSGFAQFMTQEEIESEADELLRLAAAFPADAVIEKRGDELRQRA